MKRRTVLVALLTAAAAPPPADPPGTVHMSKEQQRTIHLQTVRADRRPITEPVRVPGVVAFDQGHVAVLRPLAAAQVVHLQVAPGDRVKAGQPLADLVMPALVSAEAEFAAARASVREAEAGVAVARDALHRGVVLARDGSLSRAEAERRRLVLAQAQAALEAAQSRAAALKTEVARLDPASGPGQAAGSAVLASPIAGIVASVGITPGELVGTGGAAFTVADLSVVVALAQIPEASASLVGVGEPATLHLAGGGRVWNGTVVAIGAALDPGARTLPVRIRVPNADEALRAGMFVEVTITSNRGRQDVVIPSAAVQMIGSKQVAFVPLDGDRFQSRNLDLGLQDAGWAEIRTGVAAGESVVTTGSFELKALLQQQMLGAK